MIHANTTGKLLLNEKIKNCGRPLATFDDTFRTAINFLGNPQRLWETGKLDYQRLVLKLAFSERLPYVRNEGFRTPAKALPFSLIEQIKDGEYKMVPRERIELSTSSLPMTRSTTELPRPKISTKTTTKLKPCHGFSNKNQNI